MKKAFIIIGIIALSVLFVLHYRVPFRKQMGGPWSIGFGFAPKYPDSIVVANNMIFPYEKLLPFRKDARFMADPFFLKVKDTFFVFFELKTNEANAEIGLLTSGDGINYKFKGTVLKEPFHLSYPQVFEYKKEYYMLPESQGSNEVLLYRADNFPYKWKVCDTLLFNMKLKDPSIYLSDTLNFIVGSDNKLNMKMYVADSLFGKWTPHKKKPIAMSGTEVRPGGRISADKDGFLIPVQNQTNGYGFGLSLYRFKFKNGSYTTQRVKPFFLKQQENIPEFNAGMHQFDIQKTDKGYYYIYDGNRLISDKKKWNIVGSLKANYCDLKNFINHQIE